MKHPTQYLATWLTVSLLAASPVNAQQDRPTPPEGMQNVSRHRRGMPAAGRRDAALAPNVPAAPAAAAPAAAAPAAAAPAAPAIGKTAVLGVVTERIGEELRYQLPLIQPGAGLIIRHLMKDSPAASANMAVMDILLKWNDQLLVHPAQLQVLVESSKPGDPVDMEYLHMGTLTKARITLAEKTRPAAHGSGHHALNLQEIAPDAKLGALLGNTLLKEAAHALQKSGVDSSPMTDILKGIDPNAVAGILKGVDKNAVADLIKGIDPNAIAGILKGLDAPKKTAPTPAGGGKIVIIAADGTRKEINLGEALKPDANIGDILKTLDFEKTDPVTWLDSKILWIRPDGTQQEIQIGEMLKNIGPMKDLLKGLTAPDAH